MTTQISVSSYYYRRGGAESVMLDQNEMLESAGWDIVPWAMQYPQNFETEWSEFFPEEIDFATQYGPIEKLRKVVKSVYSFEAQKKLAALMQRANIFTCSDYCRYIGIWALPFRPLIVGQPASFSSG